MPTDKQKVDPFGRKRKRKAHNKNENKSLKFDDEKKKSLALSDKGSYYNQHEWLTEYFNAGSVFKNSDGGSDSEGDSCNEDDEDYSDFYQQ